MKFYAEGIDLQPFTIRDLLLFRKCPKAMALRRRSSRQWQSERRPLSAEAAYALRSKEAQEPGCFLLSGTVRKNHTEACADLLVKHADGWELLIDTNSVHLREAHLWEAAFQAHAFSSAGYPVRKATALLIDPEYTKARQTEWTELYIEQDISERILGYLVGVKKCLRQMRECEENECVPEHELFESCLKPRECEFWPVCSAHLPKPNVFSIVGMSNRRKFQLYRKNVISYGDCLVSAKLMKPQKMQVQYELEKSPVFVNKPAVSRFLNTLWYPIRFLDFESFQPAVPSYSGIKPFSQCAFLYSVHGMQSADSEPTHSDLFVPFGEDPRRRMAEQLCKDIPANACVAVYSSGLEKSVVRKLADMFPDLSEHLRKIASNMRDLIGPFRERIYYDRKMEGSCSLKHVLPAVAPSLSYEELDGVQNGEDAMHAYELMASMTEEERAETEERLKKYCATDTMAMVCILKTLEQAVGMQAPQR